MQLTVELLLQLSGHVCIALVGLGLGVIVVAPIWHTTAGT